METRHKVLLLDDDPDLLEIYQEILGRLPSKPEIRTATSGARAIAMLEAEPFMLLISDLRMPKMDGLQVLSIVRRKHPQLRTVVLTAVTDEQFRSRVYAQGVDLYCQKPSTDQEIKMFLECVESLLGQEITAGFRGVQSKSLVDIVQLECISQSSSVLRITNGPLHGRIWIDSGELIDAESDGARGEDAFARILSWRAGSFETLPGEASRPRTIFKSYNALLLETAQALDERAAQSANGTATGPIGGLATVAQSEGVEFALAAKSGGKGGVESHRLENADRLAAWTRLNLERLSNLGERLQAGPLEQVIGLGHQRHVAIAPRGDEQLCVGWKHELSLETIRERMRKLVALWAS